MTGFADKFKAKISKAAEDAPELVLPPAQVPGRVLHIDGDYLAYACGGAGTMPFGTAWRNLLARVDGFRLYAGACRAVLHFTDGTHKGLRGVIAYTQEYQGNRSKKPQPKPPQWAAIRGRCRSLPKPSSGEQLTAVWVADREADDSLAYVAYKYAGTGQAVICTRDKDLRMCPGLHLHWETESLVEVMDWKHIGPEGLEYGHYWFWKQMLMGDTVDHIPGLKSGVGKATADKMLADCTDDSDAYCRVLGEYCAEYGEVEGYRRFCEQAMLLWMRGDAKASPTDFAHRMHLDCLGVAGAFLRERIQEHASQTDSGADDGPPW